MPFQMLSTGKKLDAHIRERFRQWFIESGQTQAQAGKPIEWAQQTVANYFAGGQQIDIVRAVAWCDHFGYTFADLLGKTPASKPVDATRQALWEGFSRLNPEMQTALLGLVGALPSKSRQGRVVTKRVAGRRG